MSDVLPVTASLYQASKIVASTFFPGCTASLPKDAPTPILQQPRDSGVGK